MRTKLFFAFLLVIVIALISNLLFERLTMNDFDEYIKGTKEDHLYWVLASVEGSYQDNAWNMITLSEAVHWGMMLGFDIRVEDSEDREIINSHGVMEALPLSMKRRMESFIHVHAAAGEFEKYPLYIGGTELGTLYIRPFMGEGQLRIKEAIFKERGKNFMMLSFLIAGLSAVVMAVFLSLYLSRPLQKMKHAAEKIAEGDFSIRVGAASNDEIGRLAESFNYMAEALEKEELLRKHLTSNIAHELRTPITVIKAQVEGMIDGVVENTAEGLASIKGEVERLTELVEGIEDLTKAEASFFKKDIAVQVNLYEFLKGMEYAIGPVFREKGLDFIVNDRGNLDVIADTDKLELVLRNIFSNALKYTEKGGVTVDYGTRREEFFIGIADSGTGIPGDELPKIFTRFYRGRDASGKGIGIGLAIVKELVTVMGGRIEVQSTLGEGTRFTVWLPLRHQAVEGRPAKIK